MMNELLISLKNNLWLIAGLWVAMWFAKNPFHLAIRAAARIIHRGLRLTAASVLKAEEKLIERNREVLIADGQEYAERALERKFTRIGAAVERDLQRYPAIHRNMAEVVQKLEEDYNQSMDVPPALPDWVPIIENIANIKHTGDNLVANMLTEINESLSDQHKTALENYRQSAKKRHGLLQKMLPAWRKVQKNLETLEASFADLNFRTKGLDRFMEKYEQVRDGTDKAYRTLSSSSLTQFFIAGLLMAIVVGGVIINFHLIALPMSEMVGGASYLGSMKMSDVAGLVIILLELAMGLFLMETLRITRLFPIIGNLNDQKRRAMIGIFLVLLTILACIESSLAFMRDRIATDMEALRQSLAGVEMTAQATSKIPMVGQMVMGFIFPFALAFTAIPLESFIKSLRTVLGVCFVWLLRATAFLLRLLGTLGYHLGTLTVKIYDVIAFPRLIFDGFMAEKPFRANEEKDQNRKEAYNKKEKDKKVKTGKGEQPASKEEVGQ